MRDLEPGRWHTGFGVAGPDGTTRWRTRVVVGADGSSSMVGRAFRVARPSRWRRHAGITVHRVEAGGQAHGVPATARMFLGRGWYCGLAPATDGRINIGIVMGEAELQRRMSHRGDLPALVDGILHELPGAASRLREAPSTDDVRIALPLAHRVARPSGPGFRWSAMQQGSSTH